MSTPAASARRHTATPLVATAAGLMCVAWLALLAVAIGTADVGIEGEPQGPSYLGGLSPWYLLPAGLALVSLLLGVAGLRRRMSV